jgi:hypothetical protein
MDVEPAANEIRDDVGLEIRERQDQIGLQSEDLVDVRRREGAHALSRAGRHKDAPLGRADGAATPSSVDRIGRFGIITR